MKIVSRVVVFAAIFLLSLQYIGCGGAELSSAKLYRQQRNYLKANDLLEQALKSDPTSDEAWSLYVTNLYDLNRYEKIAEVIDTARLYAVKNRVQVEYVRRNTWVGLYNGALNAYQQNPDSKEQQDAAVALLESARKVAPEQPETYELLGDVYYSAGDTAKYIATYEEALKQVRSIHDQGVALGLMLKQDPAGAESAIGGAPARKEMVALSSTDSVMIYVYPSKEAYLYFEKTKKTPRKWQLTGWKFTNSEPVGMQPTRVSLRPYQSIAQYYLDKGNASLAAKDTARAEESFEKAVSLLISVQRLDPSDESAASIIPNTYNRLGQREKMKSEYERMLAERPSKNLWSSYGVALMLSDDYAGAITAFEKALEIDPSYQNALFNLGATYQNMASNDQKKKAAIKDKKKLEELDKTFKEDLTKAIEYFEKLHTVNNKDYTTILYLIQDYDALENKEKSSKFLNELDNLRNTELYKDENYWLAVGKAYAKPDPKKSLLAFKTADAITEARKKANQSELERLIESLDKLTKAVEESNKK